MILEIGSSCAIHADNYKIKDKKIHWEFKDKVFKMDFVGWKKIKVGGLKSAFEERPIIKLNIIFNGETFKDIPFTLTNRINNNKTNKSEILIDRNFMKLARCKCWSK